MSAHQNPLAAPHVEPHAAHEAHHERGFIRTYIFSTDHKVISVQFLFTALLMMILGGLLAMAVRWQLAWPFDPAHKVPILNNLLGWNEAGDIMPSSFYGMLFTMHG